ncbi:MAG: hypothetical protein MUC41_15785, partial [Syntrophobacteraceae bacterium]|nr:hypothetical protein [Syntrophobacteraceae bacterium]
LVVHFLSQRFLVMGVDAPRLALLRLAAPISQRTVATRLPLCSVNPLAVFPLVLELGLVR